MSLTCQYGYPFSTVADSNWKEESNHAPLTGLQKAGAKGDAEGSSYCSRIIRRNLCARAFGWRTVWTGLSRGDLILSAQAASRFFDPGLLLGNQALHKLRALLLGGLDTFLKKHLANLRQNPLLIVRYALQLTLEFRSDSPCYMLSKR
jgi:hypothetical protein